MVAKVVGSIPKSLLRRQMLVANLEGAFNCKKQLD